MISHSELSHLIGQIYDSAMNGQWHGAVDDIRAKTSSNKIFFVVRDLQVQQTLVTEFAANFDYDQQLLLTYAESIDEDPWYQAAQMSLEGDLVRYSELIPVATFQNLAIYENIFRPLRSYHCMGGVLLRNDKYEALFALNRGESELPYSEDDYALLELLMPHLSSAIKLYVELKAYKNIANVAEGISRNSSKAILLCDEHSNILEHNDLAGDLIQYSHHFVSNLNKLSLVKDYLGDNVRKMIAENARFYRDNHGCRKSFLLDEGDEKLVIEVTPLKKKYSLVNTEVDCCLVIITPEKTVDWSAVSNEYQLTPRELAISELVYAKQRVADIAKSLSIKENTVRTHLQNIYTKLRVKTQAEFIVSLNMFSR